MSAFDYGVEAGLFSAKGTHFRPKSLEYRRLEYRRFGRAAEASKVMTKFKITVARIEEIAADGRDSQVRVTFHIDRGPTRFQVPIFLNMKDFDDTEMVQAARDVFASDIR